MTSLIYINKKGVYTMAKKERMVQISYKTFIETWAIFNDMVFDEERYNEYYESVKAELNNKLNRMVNHQLFTKYKTAPTEEEKQKALDEYFKHLQEYL